MYLTLILLPLLGSISSGLFGRKIGRTGSQIITTLCIGTSCVLTIIGYKKIVIDGNIYSINIINWLNVESLHINYNLLLDSLSISMLIPITVISFVVHIYSISYMSSDPHLQRFMSYISLFTFFMIILVTGSSYLLMFIGWEGIGVSSYLLINFWFTSIESNKASISALLVNRVGDIFITIAMALMYYTYGNHNYNTISSLSIYYNENILYYIGICLLIGSMAKSAQVPLNKWLPESMVAPTPTSSLLHAATLVTAGVYLLIRSSYIVEMSDSLLIIILFVGSFTTIISGIIGILQYDVKRIIAYSTCSQIGMCFVSIGISNYNLALYHLINHSMYKALLFLCAGIIIHSLNDEQDIRKMGGLIKYLPFTYSCMLIASLSLMAIPSLSGYYSKDLIIELLYGKYLISSIICYWLSAISAMLTSLYSMKILYNIFLSQPNRLKLSYYHCHEGDIFMVIPLIILTVLSIFIGYVTSDIFIGPGSLLYSDTLFIQPYNNNTLDLEFSIPIYYKLLPFIGSIFLSGLLLYFYEVYNYYNPFNRKNISLSKANNIFISNKYIYGVYTFVNKRFYHDIIYNRYLTLSPLNLGFINFTIFDKGIANVIGPNGLYHSIFNYSKIIRSMNNGVLSTYIIIAIVIIITGTFLIFFDGNDYIFLMLFTLLIYYL